MIARKELEYTARALGLNSYQAEKDYLQHAFLSALYAISAGEFVFKGGTALQKAYGLDRFSEDLDFTFAGSGKNAPELLTKALEELSKFAEAGIAKKEEREGSFSAKLKIRGPLFDGNERSVQTLLVEISMREKILKNPFARRIVPSYADLRPYIALCMEPEEALAEKARAILTRDKARDVYDFWFLLKKGAVFNKEYADAKLAYYGRKFEISEFRKAVENKKRIWKRELGVLLKSVPEFEEISREVVEAIAGFEAGK